MSRGIAIVFTINIIVLLTAVFLLNPSECKDSVECLTYKEQTMPDFYWQYDTIRHVASSGDFPTEVLYTYVRDNRVMKQRWPMWHSPLYYYLASPILIAADKLNTDKVTALHLFSVFVTAMTNLIFLLFLGSIKKYVNNKNFTFYAFTLFVFLPTHLFVGVIVHNDVLFYLFFITSLYFCLRLVERQNKVSAVLFGAVLALTLMTRLSGIMVMAAVFVYAMTCHLRKRHRLGNLLLSSLLIGFLGIYPIVRNLVFFGQITRLGDDIVRANPYLLVKMFTGFWGGIYGGLNNHYFLMLAVAIVAATTAFGLFLSGKTRAFDFMLVIAALTILLGVYWNCNIFGLVKLGYCTSTIPTMNRYFIPLEPLIAILSAVSLSRVKTRMAIPVLLFAAFIFALEFLAAF